MDLFRLSLFSALSVFFPTFAFVSVPSFSCSTAAM